MTRGKSPLKVFLYTDTPFQSLRAAALILASRRFPDFEFHLGCSREALHPLHIFDSSLEPLLLDKISEISDLFKTNCPQVLILTGPSARGLRCAREAQRRRIPIVYISAKDPALACESHPDRIAENAHEKITRLSTQTIHVNLIAEACRFIHQKMAGTFVPLPEKITGFQLFYLALHGTPSREQRRFLRGLKIIFRKNKNTRLVVLGSKESFHDEGLKKQGRLLTFSTLAPGPQIQLMRAAHVIASNASGVREQALYLRKPFFFIANQKVAPLSASLKMLNQLLALSAQSPEYRKCLSQTNLFPNGAPSATILNLLKNHAKN